MLDANPLRQRLVDAATAGDSARAKARARWLGERHSKDATLLVVLGGSLGARPVNEALACPKTGAAALLAEDPTLHVLWQCGRGANFDDVVAAVEPHPRLRIAPFLDADAIRDALLAADAAVCRAGALTVSELTLFGVPSVLVPSPHVADDHQAANARALASEGAAEVVLESELANLPATLRALLGDSARRLEMASSARKAGAGAAGAADRIAEAILASSLGEDDTASGAYARAQAPAPAWLSQ